MGHPSRLFAAVAGAAASVLAAASAHALVVHFDPPTPIFDFTVSDPSVPVFDSTFNGPANVVPLNIPGSVFSSTFVPYVQFGRDGETLTFNAGTSSQFSEKASMKLWDVTSISTFFVGTKELNVYDVSFPNLTGTTIVTFTGPNGTTVGTVTVLPSPGVPEPASWALMLVGVGALGAVLRGRRRQSFAAI